MYPSKRLKISRYEAATVLPPIRIHSNNTLEATAGPWKGKKRAKKGNIANIIKGNAACGLHQRFSRLHKGQRRDELRKFFKPVLSPGSLNKNRSGATASHTSQRRPHVEQWVFQKLCNFVRLRDARRTRARCKMHILSRMWRGGVVWKLNGNYEKRPRRSSVSSSVDVKFSESNKGTCPSKTDATEG